MKIDIIVDLSYGDCGKGKVTNYLLETDYYTHCMRYNGGHNAGHTIIYNGEKVITHIIPTGVLSGIKSIIGPGCVLNIEKFFEEMNKLTLLGIDNLDDLVKISNNTHIITNSHLEEDAKDVKIGTTKQGNGQAYRDKYERTGKRAEDYPELKRYLIDVYEEFHIKNPYAIVLMEGAQGFGLDIDWGDYPYVSSSHSSVAGALSNGFSWQDIRRVYGVIKAYETYVGTKQFQGKDPIFERIQQIGEEFGATTGRKRQVNWLNTDMLKKAIKMNGVTDLIVNKVDVLEKVGEWKTRNNFDEFYRFIDKNHFCDFIRSMAEMNGVQYIYFSESPDKI